MLMKKRRKLPLRVHILMPMPPLVLRATFLEGTKPSWKPKPEAEQKEYPSRSFAEILHSGKGTSYIVDYVNGELFRFSTQYVQMYPQLTAQYSATGPSAPDWLRDGLEPVSFEEGLRLIERILQRDESVIDEVEKRITWRPRPTGLAEEMRTPIGGVDLNVLSALEDEAKRSGVNLEEVEGEGEAGVG